MTIRREVKLERKRRETTPRLIAALKRNPKPKKAAKRAEKVLA